jgi:hypothetical protein
MTDHRELLNDWAHCQGSLFHGKNNEISSHSLILYSEDDRAQAGFLI